MVTSPLLSTSADDPAAPAGRRPSAGFAHGSPGHPRPHRADAAPFGAERFSPFRMGLPGRLAMAGLAVAALWAAIAVGLA